MVVVQQQGMPSVMLQTPTGRIAVPLSVLPGHGPVAPGNEVSLSQLIRSNPHLREELVAAWRDEVGNQQADELPQEPEPLARAILLEPRLLELVTQWLHSSPEARNANGVTTVSHVQNGSMSSTELPPIFRAAREGECGVVEQLLGPRSGERLRREVSPVGDTL